MPQMRVWLPISTTQVAVNTGFTNLPDEQVDALVEHYRTVQSDLISPEPLGKRETFAWRLEADLNKASDPRPSLADFTLLLEAAIYGLLQAKTFDLSKCSFVLHPEEDRYLTVLTYQAGEGAAPSVAGSFSPDTLLCPAANWKGREQLEQRVNRMRDSQSANGGRSLLRVFYDQYRDMPMPWVKAIRHLLEIHPAAALDAGEVNQSNLGPFLLRMGRKAKPHLLFLPTFSPNRLPDLVQRFQGSSYQHNGDSVDVSHNGHRLCSVQTPGLERPKLFGLGAVHVDPAAELPTQAAFNNETKDKFKKVLASVVNAYQEELGKEDLRFHLPDALRAVTHALGRGPALALLKGGEGSRHIYSDEVNAHSFTGLPHQGQLLYGSLQSPAQGVYFADQIPNGRIAIYIQSWQDQTFGELTALGAALWQVFRSNRKRGESPEQTVQALFREDNGRLSTTAVAEKPRLQEMLSWSNYRHWIDSQPSPLLRCAALEFATAYGQDIPAAKRSETVIMKIGHHDWLVPE